MDCEYRGPSDAARTHLGPMQEALLRIIHASPGCSQNKAIRRFRWRGSAQRSVRALADKDMIRVDLVGPGRRVHYALYTTERGEAWLSVSRPWELGFVYGVARRRAMTPLESLIQLAETTTDYDERERLVDEVGDLVARQIAAVTAKH